MNNTSFNNHSTNGSNSPYGQGDTQGLLDPSLAFNNINPGTLDFSHLQNPLLQQRLNDARSPQAQGQSQPQGFPSPAYNVNAVVPAKRPRATDDVGASPRTSQGPPGNSSRSQTPQQQQQQQQQQPGFQNSFPSQQMSQFPNPYQHLQQQQQQQQQSQQHQSSNHASPSPVPNQQQFSQAGLPQATNSPLQFNQNFGGFPPHMQNRPSAPQTPTNPAFMRGATPQHPAGGQNGALTDAQRQQYQLKLQQQVQMQQQAQQQAQQHLQGSNMMQNRQMGQGMGPTSSPAVNMPNGPNMQPQVQGQPAQTQAKQGLPGEAGFMKSLFGFLSQRGINLEPEPKVSGRTINYFHLFQEASKKGVILPNTNQAHWPFVAAALGFPANQYPNAAEELKGIFQRNLMAFSQTWVQMVQKRKMQMMQQQQKQQQQQQQQQGTPGPQGTPQPQQQPQTAGGGARPQQMSPPRSANSMNMGAPGGDPSQPPLQLQAQFQTPVASQAQAGTPVQAQSSSPQANGLFTPQNQNFSIDRANSLGHERSTSSAQPSVLPAGSPQPALQTPPRGPQAEAKEKAQQPTPVTSRTPLQEPTPIGKPEVKKDEYVPVKRFLTYPVHVDVRGPAPGSVADPYFGGLPTEHINVLGKRLSELKPGVPAFEEMGTVDIHALTMSIQSGIRAEVRYALDQLVGLSHDVRVTIPLHECEILVESLIECGEEQLDILKEPAEEIKDTAELPLVENLAKVVAQDGLGVQKLPFFGTSDFELDHAADRLIAISTILRNLSCPDHLANHEVLAGPFCINFIASIIRTVATHRNVLRNAQNTQDVMKDIVTMLSQIAHRLEIPSEEDALSLLQLLTSFTPAPGPTPDPSTNLLTFTPYNPKTHQYLPSAIDALAKLLARDYPNRIYFKSIFANEPVTSTPPNSHNLLTRAFALAIAPIPDRHAPHIDPLRGDLIRLAHARNPFFSQGMLAADILASLAPGPNDALARSWLESEDGWAPSLLHLLFQLSHEANQGHAARQATTGKLLDWEIRGVNIITTRGLSMLRRLAEKVDGGSSEGSGRSGAAVNGTSINGHARESKARKLPLSDVLPDRDAVLRAVTDIGFEGQALKQLLAFAALDG